MRGEALLGTFEELTGLSKGPARLRELVLQLAIHGRLSSLDPKTHRPEVSLPRLASVAVGHPGARRVPTGWLSVPLGKLGEWRGGGTPSSSRPDFWTGKIPWVSPKDMKVLFVGDAQDHISEAAVEGSSVRLIAAGSLLMVVRGMILARAFPVALSTRDVTVNQDMKALLLHEPEMKDYLLLALRALEREVLAGVTHSTHGTCKLEMSFLTDLLIPIPPLAEQKRIVAKVDELMALCDHLEAQQQERESRRDALASASLTRFSEDPTPANLEFLFHKSYDIEPGELRRAILTCAVQGRLVPRVSSEGIALDGKTPLCALGPLPEGRPVLPSHWTWVALGDVTTKMDSGWSPACQSAPSAKSSWGVLKTTAVQQLRYREEQNKTLPAQLQPRPEHEVLDGDILITRAGPMNRVGIVCVARPTRPKLMISDKIIRFHLVTEIDADFAALALTAGYSNQFIEGLKSGMAESQMNISQPKLRTVPLPVPPPLEQRRIVAKVNQLMVLIDRLEAQRAASCPAGEKLLEAVVAELTEGASAA